MRTLLVGALAVIAIGAFSSDKAQARVSPSGLAVPSLVDQVQCVTRTVRTRRANGTVVVRKVRDCGRPGVVVRAPAVRIAPNCRTVKTRVREGNRTVVRTRRVC